MNITYNQWTEFKEDTPGNIDTKMYLVNQAAMGVWYQLRNAELWRTYITLLYSIVIDGFGRQVGDSGAFPPALPYGVFSAGDVGPWS